MVVVEAHYYFCVAVVERDGVDFHEDFVWARDGQWSGGRFEVFETVLGGDPLLNFGGRRHGGGDCNVLEIRVGSWRRIDARWKRNSEMRELERIGAQIEITKQINIRKRYPTIARSYFGIPSLPRNDKRLKLFVASQFWPWRKRNRI